MITQYLQQEDGAIRFSGPVNKLKKLPAGTYSASQDQFGNIYLNPFDTHTDKLIALSGSPAEKINREVDYFLSEDVRKRFKRYDLLYKRGLLMHGVPGTGKTSIVHLLMRQAIKKDMVVLINPEPYLVCSIVDNVRGIEKDDRPFMIVWEEFERWVDKCEGDLLDLLDGVDQVDNAFFLATTNYIEQIPPRIRNRPSRFADVIEIGTPGPALRKAFIHAKVHRDDNVNLQEWVDKTEGLTIDHLKDLIISVLVLEVPLDDAIAKVRRMEQEDLLLGNGSKKSVLRLAKQLLDKEISETKVCDEPMEAECKPLGG